MAKKAPQAQKNMQRVYSSESLLIRGIGGILLIAFGVLALLSVTASLEGAAFSTIRHLVWSLGGSLHIVFPLFFIWGGILVSLSARRKPPIRAFVLTFIIYLMVLSFITLITRVQERANISTALMDYIPRINREKHNLADPTGYGAYLSQAYTLSGDRGQGGGLLGMLLAWPLWATLGPVGGCIVLVLSMLGLAIPLFHLDLKAITYNLQQRNLERQARRDQEDAYAQMQDRQWRMQQAQQNPYPQGAMNGYPPSQGGYAQQTAEAPPEEYAPRKRFNLSSLFRRGGETPMETEAYPQQQPMAPAPAPMPRRPQPRQPQQPLPLYDEVIASQEMAGSRFSVEEAMTRSRARKAGTPPPPAAPVPDDLPWEETPEPPKPQRSRSREADNASYQRPATARRLPLDDDPQEMIEETPPPPTTTRTRTPVVKEPAMSGERLDKPDLKLPESTKKVEQLEMPLPPPYVYPTLDMLKAPKRTLTDTSAEDEARAIKLEETLQSFGITAYVKYVTHGPAITRFELELASGINVKKITNIADNIALSLAANGVRIEAPIPGKSLVGIEVPNAEINSVTLKEVLQSDKMEKAESPLAVALGKDIAGAPVVCDLARMPHLLIAGATGSGKSVCINSIINSIIFRASPSQVRMILIDPKVVELQCYNGIPHLIIPVVSDPHKAAGALTWAVAEMMERYHKFTEKGVRDMTGYNNALGPDDEALPRILVVIDELADLMMACKKDVESSICRLAQLARAAGIHLVVATQRPSVDVITGLIKANIPSRIAFAVSSNIDSRTILDTIGAEKLLGKGDMLYSPSGSRNPVRVQGCFVSDSEVNKVTAYVRSHSTTDYDPSVIEQLEAVEHSVFDAPDMDAGDAADLDPLLRQAIEMAIEDGQTSISMLQRRLRIGYARSGRLIDDMTRRGIISQAAGAKPREVLITRDELESMDLE